MQETPNFTLLLIEEPEAHLHPQLQVKFIKYLESLASTLSNAQIIVSTHSPVLASSVEINKLIHLSGTAEIINFHLHSIDKSLSNTNIKTPRGFAPQFIDRIDVKKNVGIAIFTPSFQGCEYILHMAILSLFSAINDAKNMLFHLC